MYPPQADSIVRNPDGSLTATSAGHVIIYGPDGSITVWERSGKIVFSKPGS
jgi:hypothetical protein